MKSSILTVMIAVSAILLSCGAKTPKKKNDVYILVDNTEKVAYKNDMVATQAILGLVGNRGTVTFKALTGVSINAEAEASVLVDGSTSVLRQDQIDPFVEKLDSLKKKYFGVITEYKTSSLWVPICQAIKKLNNSILSDPNSAGTKTLIIMSDMLENSEYGNFYKDIPYETVKKGLEVSGDTLPKNCKVKVVVVFNPEQSIEKEKKHKKAMKYWHKFFEESGIEYEVTAKMGEKL